MLDKGLDNQLHTLKIHHLHQVMDNLELVACLEVLDVSPFERSDVHRKQSYYITSQRQNSGMLKSISNMDRNRQEDMRRTDSMPNAETPLEVGKDFL